MSVIHNLPIPMKWMPCSGGFCRSIDNVGCVSTRAFVGCTVEKMASSLSTSSLLLADGFSIGWIGEAVLDAVL